MLWKRWIHPSGICQRDETGKRPASLDEPMPAALTLVRRILRRENLNTGFRATLAIGARTRLC